jgi:hypothetical protein
MMMNTQESWFLYQGASHLGTHGGTLRVEAGQVWLTSSGDPDDHFLQAGDAIRVPPGDALVESVNRGAPARIVWQPRSLLERWLAVWHNAAREWMANGREAGERRGIVAKEARCGSAGAA